MALTFDALRTANTLRLPQFKNALGHPAHMMADGSDWSPADWFVATVGELGEAANLMKKIRRNDFVTKDIQAARLKLAKEYADVVIYLDLMAKQYGIDLGDAVTLKFNEVSERIGSSIFLKES